VSERPYQVATFDDLSIQTLPDRARWAMVRSHFDIRAFGINAWEANAEGQPVVSEHDELGPGTRRHEELYFVAKGGATFTINGEEVDAPEGTFVFVRDPAAKRGAVSRTADTIVVAIGGPRGEAFEPSPWERSAEALRYWETGEFERAIELLSAALEEEPGNVGVRYNLACAEARLGRKDDALGHLREAAGAEERFREAARDDPDFESIRDDPAFAEIVGAQPA
jgi:tetratricopeptide (TPR) repeat protein